MQYWCYCDSEEFASRHTTIAVPQWWCSRCWINWSHKACHKACRTCLLLPFFVVCISGSFTLFWHSETASWSLFCNSATLQHISFDFISCKYCSQHKNNSFRKFLMFKRLLIISKYMLWQRISVSWTSDRSGSRVMHGIFLSEILCTGPPQQSVLHLNNKWLAVWQRVSEASRLGWCRCSLLVRQSYTIQNVTLYLMYTYRIYSHNKGGIHCTRNISEKKERSNMWGSRTMVRSWQRELNLPDGTVHRVRETGIALPQLSFLPCLVPTILPQRPVIGYCFYIYQGPSAR